MGMQEANKPPSSFQLHSAPWDTQDGAIPSPRVTQGPHTQPAPISELKQLPPQLEQTLILQGFGNTPFSVGVQPAPPFLLAPRSAARGFFKQFRFDFINSRAEQQARAIRQTIREQLVAQEELPGPPLAKRVSSMDRPTPPSKCHIQCPQSLFQVRFSSR